MAAVSVVNQSQVGRELTRWTARVISNRVFSFSSCAVNEACRLESSCGSAVDPGIPAARVPESTVRRTVTRHVAACHSRPAPGAALPSDGRAARGAGAWLTEEKQTEGGQTRRDAPPWDARERERETIDAYRAPWLQLVRV